MRFDYLHFVLHCSHFQATNVNETMRELFLWLNARVQLIMATDKFSQFSVMAIHG